MAPLNSLSSSNRNQWLPTRPSLPAEQPWLALVESENVRLTQQFCTITELSSAERLTTVIKELTTSKQAGVQII